MDLAFSVPPTPTVDLLISSTTQLVDLMVYAQLVKLMLTVVLVSTVKPTELV
jgi:hypothetical protein